MREFFSQQPGGAPLEGLNNLIGCFTNRSFDKQIDMIWLDGKLDDSPSVIYSHAVKDLWQALGNLTNQNPLAPLGYPNEVVFAGIDGVTPGLILVQVVDIIPLSTEGTTMHKRKRRFFSPLKEGAFPHKIL